MRSHPVLTANFPRDEDQEYHHHSLDISTSDGFSRREDSSSDDLSTVEGNNIVVIQPKENEYKPVEKSSFYLTTVFRIFFTFVAICVLLSPVVIGYIFRFSLVNTSWFGIGLYGVAIIVHYTLQILFATLNRREVDKSVAKRDVFWKGPRIGLLGVGYKEDPIYFKLCLESLLQSTFKGPLKILIMIDGDDKEDQYMGDIFMQTYQHLDPVVINAGDAFFYGQNGSLDALLKQQILNATGPICILQKHEGKRRAMYSGFKILLDLFDVEAVITVDSDTVLEPEAISELAHTLDDPKVAAGTGFVSILNRNSILPLMSYLRYWMAFNVERACQSYWGCVVCISGPLGIYRSSVIRQIREQWFEQTFLGALCSYGDDRHLTNLVLATGQKVKFTHRAVAFTETPAEFFRWIAQQTRWSKSFFREFLFSVTIAHKQSLWMIYEQVYQCKIDC